MSATVKRYCVMPSCKGEKMDLVHKFPRNDERAREWLSILKIPELEEIPLEALRKSKFVCTRHFAPEAYKHAQSRSLNINAIPSRNLDKLETLEHIIHRERKDRIPLPKEHFDEIGQATTFDYFEVEPAETEEILIIPSPKKKLKLKLMPVKRRKLQQAPKKDLWEESNETVQLEAIPNEITEILEEKEEELQINETESPKIDFLQIEDEEKFPGGIRLNYFWLRDHCRCEKCYDKDTSQRKMALTDINLDIKPLDYEIEENRIRVSWPDDHQSLYDLDFLYNSQYSIRKPLYEESKSILWTSENISTEPVANIDLNDLLCNDSSVKKILESLIKYGVAFVNKVPATQHSTEMTITRLFPLMKTFFGEMWTFSDTKDHHDFAYTNNYLPAHNDNTYFNDAAGLQILHCIQHQGEGGENFLVDGFHVLSEMKKEHPEAFQRLCEYQVPSEYIEEGRNHRHIGPIIKLNALNGKPEQLRFNMNDRACLDTIPFDKIQEFYSDVHLLASFIQKKSNEWSFKLNPGTVLIFDNWRIFHGRQKYTGKRVMTGSYVLRSEFLSAARVAGVIL